MNADTGTSYPINSEGTLCEQIRALIPAYSIGATDPSETAFVEANLERCPDAAAELTDYLMLADELLYVTAPERVQRPAPTIRKAPPIGSQSKMAPAVPGTPSRRRWMTAAAAVLALVMFGGVNLFWAGQVATLQQEQLALQTQLNELTVAQVPISNGQVYHRDLLPNSDTNVSNDAYATLIWNSAREVGSLYVKGLPTLSADKRYQLWVVRDGHSLSLGLFTVDSTGIGTLVFEAAEPIEDFQHIGISEEPATGSPVPTTPHLVLGTI